MIPSQLYRDILARLESRLVFLPDKPEETVEATLAALWCCAAGTPLSVERAASEPLTELDTKQQAALLDLVELRLSGTPLAHLTGRQQFMGIELLASGEALIPRKETEILGRAAHRLLDEMKKETQTLRVMDVCTGAGNLAVSMALHCSRCMVVASDLSPEAVALARKNVDFLQLSDRVTLFEGDLFAPFDSPDYYQSIDLLTCNPPYISTAKVGEMEEEIAGHEPSLAFDGGAFGIKIVHRFIQDAPKYLKRGGWLAFEIGLGQGKSLVKRMEKKYSYTRVVPVTDAHDEIRVILARL
jgi:release factor glutamine methyltransferase